MLRLEIVRREQGLSQSALARAAGMAAPSVSQIERGRLIPYPGQVARIAAALQWEGDPAELFKPIEVVA